MRTACISVVRSQSILRYENTLSRLVSKLMILRASKSEKVDIKKLFAGKEGAAAQEIV